MENNKTEIKAAEVTEAVYFTNSQDCAACAMLKDKMEELGGYINITKFDTATDEGLEAAKKYNLRSVPALYVEDIDFIGVPNIVKILHPVINHHKSLAEEEEE